MQVYTRFKDNQFINPVLTLTPETHLEPLDNSFVIPFQEHMSFQGIPIPPMNNRGFISLRHLKQILSDHAQDQKDIDEQNKINYTVIALLEKHNTTLHDIKITIHLLSNGRSIKPRWSKALDAISDNQNNGSKSWLIFLKADFDKN